MRANELRIGNLVQFNNLIGPAEIITINARFFSSLAGGRSSDEMKADEELNAYWSGITLTEEWLIKVNFRKVNEKLYFLPIPLLSMEIHAEFFRNQWLIELSNDRKNIVTECLTLHQLQNLYHSLTGEELEVK